MRASRSSADDVPILENSIAGVMPYTHKRPGDERAASRKGERVEVHGLTGAPQHNGVIGRVKGRQGDRVTVTLPAATVALLPANLRKAPGETNN